jgi:hypothetical protein
LSESIEASTSCLPQHQQHGGDITTAEITRKPQQVQPQQQQAAKEAIENSY